MIVLRMVIGGLAGLVLLVPWAGRVFGSKVRALEMVTAPEPQYLTLSVGLLLCAFLLRRRWVIALAGGAVLYHAAMVAPWYFGRPGADGRGIPLRVLSFNVLHHNTRFDEVVDWVMKQEPEVAVFQEVTVPWPEELQKLRGAFPYHFRVAELQMDVFSKRPILNPEYERYGKMRGFIRFEIDIGRLVTIYATHTYPLIHFGVEGFGWHREHLVEGLPVDVARQGENPVVVLGDLNATMWSPHYAALVEKTGLRNARQGFGVCLSLSDAGGWKPWKAVAFDHCLVGGGIGVEAFRTGPYLGSDHLPIVAELRVPR